MRQTLSICLLVGLTLAACTHNTPKADSAPAQTENGPAANRTPYQDQQLLDSLLSTMGSVQDKVVADLFAGDGFYTWGLLRAGARVLAIDDDPTRIAALEARKKQEGIGDDKLLIRLTQPGVPGLLPNEADLALVTREFSMLGDRPAWFAQLLPGIRAPHTFYLVNFLPGQTVAGPALSLRMNYNTVIDEIAEYGFHDVGVYYKKLPYQYILFASIPPEQAE